MKENGQSHSWLLHWPFTHSPEFFKFWDVVEFVGTVLLWPSLSHIAWSGRLSLQGIYDMVVKSNCKVQNSWHYPQGEDIRAHIHKVSQSRSDKPGSINFFLDHNQYYYMASVDMILNQHSYSDTLWIWANWLIFFGEIACSSGVRKMGLFAY